MMKMVIIIIIILMSIEYDHTKRKENEYNHSHKMGIVPLQLKIKNFYYEIRDYGDKTIGDNNGDKTIYIENSDKEFFEKMREIWNKVIELININNAPNFVKNTLDDNSEFTDADVLENTNFIKSNCYKDELIIVLHSAVNDNLQAPLLEVIRYEY